jgi:hypothetical protein
MALNANKKLLLECIPDFLRISAFWMELTQPRHECMPGCWKVAESSCDLLKHNFRQKLGTRKVSKRAEVEKRNQREDEKLTVTRGRCNLTIPGRKDNGNDEEEHRDNGRIPQSEHFNDYDRGGFEK